MNPPRRAVPRRWTASVDVHADDGRAIRSSRYRTRAQATAEYRRLVQLATVDGLDSLLDEWYRAPVAQPVRAARLAVETTGNVAGRVHAEQTILADG